MFNLFSKNKVRTRFAPSPTGYLHVGGLRTALYAYLFARQNQGKFILRVEDTDQTREVAGAVENLLKSLAWTGLAPDEGVFLDRQGKMAEKGSFGPYTQSRRTPIYQKYAKKLLEKGLAYRCFCSAQRLEGLRQTQEAAGLPTRYDWRCRHLTLPEIEKKLKEKEKFVLRLKVPENYEVEFYDWVRGQVKFNTKEIDDQIILKSDGFPTYHLASVVDDHFMKISHVIRGEEWLSSTPKHILLYHFFGWKIPDFIHLPLILNPDKSKLAKRQGDVAVEDYIKAGYLPEALINFVALLGWNPGTEQEIFTLPELIKEFDLRKIHKAGAVFNREKLDWLNSEYIKNMNPRLFADAAMPFLERFSPPARGGEANSGVKRPELAEGVGGEAPEEKSNIIKKILALEQSRIHKLSEVGEGVKFLFADKLSYNPEVLVWKKSDKPTTIQNLELLMAELQTYGAGESVSLSRDEWTKEKLEEKIKQFIKAKNLDTGGVLWPMRVALTGQEKSPPPFDVAEILGQEKTLGRLKAAINLLR